MNYLISKYFLIFTIFFSASTVYAYEVQDIGNQDLIHFIIQGVTVIDVRATSEWRETGVIEGSHLIMFYDEKGSYDLNAWLVDVAKVASKDEPIVLICHSGNRSKQLANYLSKIVGYKVVYNARRGINYWIKQNNSVVKYK